MRILQVFNRYIERGGEEASVERISDTLSERHTVFHCYFDSRQLRGGPGILGSATNAFAMVWNPQSARRLQSHVQATKPDIILLHNIFPVGTASLLAAVGGLGIPAISYIHNFRPYSVNGYLWANDKIEPAGLRQNFLPEVLAGSWQDSRLKTGVYASILSGMHFFRLFDNISVWIAISNFMRDKFIEAGIPHDKIITIRHSCDPLSNPPLFEDLGYFLFLGRLITAKGIRVLLEAWQLLEARFGSETPKLVIGGDGPMADAVTKACRQSKYIQYVGQVEGEQKNELIQGCRAMLAPSLWWEGLGLVTYEAYDRSKPMLAAGSGGLLETVCHGETGFLHEPGKASQLADHVMEIEKNPALRVHMGSMGRKWLVKNTQRSQWLDAFDQALLLARQEHISAVGCR